MKLKTTLLLIILVLICRVSFSQSKVNFQYPDSLNKRKLKTTVGLTVGSYTAGISFLSFIWYKDHQRVPFHYYNDAKGYLQIDKWGHAYGAYWESYYAYHALRVAGVPKNKALLYGGPMGLIFQTPIEIFDGLYEGWGFSWPDMIANTLGATLFTFQTAAFDRQVALLKFSYSPSIYPPYYPAYFGDTPIQHFFLDYNAHTYWLSLNLQDITGSDKIPAWLNLSLGYSANGMLGEFVNPRWYRGQPLPHFERYRQYILSLDVDFTRIPTKKVWMQRLFRALNLVKVPFPGVELNRINGIRLRPLYY